MTAAAVRFALAHPVRARRFLRAARAPWPPAPTSPPTVDRDRGFMLLELVVALALVGLLLPAIASATVMSLRGATSAERSSRAAVAMSTSGAVIARMDGAAICADPAGAEAALASQVALPATGWTLTATPDCAGSPVLVVVDLDGPGGLVRQMTAAAAVVEVTP